MASEWVDEVCGDVFGTRFVGMVATNTMAQAAMQAGSDSGDAHAQLCGTLHGQAVPAAFTEVGTPHTLTVRCRAPHAAPDDPLASGPNSGPGPECPEGT